jgi:hypothetical protein
MFSSNATPAKLAATFPFIKTNPVAYISTATSPNHCGEFGQGGDSVLLYLGGFVKDIESAKILTNLSQTQQAPINQSIVILLRRGNRATPNIANAAWISGNAVNGIINDRGGNIASL